MSESVFEIVENEFGRRRCGPQSTHSNTPRLCNMWPFISDSLTSVGSSSLSVHPFPLPPLFSCPVIWSDVFQFPNDSSTLNWLEEHHSGTYARKSDFPMFVHSKRRSRQRLSMPVFSLVARSSQEPISHRPRPVQPLSLFSRPSSWPFIPLGLQSLFVSCAPSPKQKKNTTHVRIWGFILLLNLTF